MPLRTFTRSQLLVGFLSRVQSERTGQVFLRSRGDGVRKILEGGEAHSARRPEYALIGDELRLTLWAKDTARGPMMPCCHVPHQIRNSDEHLLSPKPYEGCLLRSVRRFSSTDIENFCR